MNQNYTEYKFPQARARPHSKPPPPPLPCAHLRKVPSLAPSPAAPLVSQVKPHPWHKVFRPRTPSDAIELVSRFLRYSPDSRIKPLEACAMPFFDELRDQGLQLPGNRAPPPLFDFKPQGALARPAFFRVCRCTRRSAQGAHGLLPRAPQNFSSIRPASEAS